MDEVATKIIDILKKHMKEPRDDIGLSTALTDLKIESLDLAMIVFDIEDSFGIEIPYNANEEAADLLELDVRNFKSRLHRGRMALRQQLEELSDTS